MRVRMTSLDVAFLLPRELSSTMPQVKLLYETYTGSCLACLWKVWRLQGQQVLFKAPVIPDLRVDSAVQLQYCRGRAFADVTQIHGELLSPLSGLNPLLSTASGRPSLPAVIPTAAPATCGASWPNAVTPTYSAIDTSDCANLVMLPCASRQHSKQRSKAHAVLWCSAACWNVSHLCIHDSNLDMRR